MHRKYELNWIEMDFHIKYTKAAFLIKSFYGIYEYVTYRTPCCDFFIFQLVSVRWGGWCIFGDLCPSNAKKKKKQDGSKCLKQLTGEKIARSGHWQIGG